jgi:hypothetical protein
MKCPECGSTAIEVNVKFGLSLTNDTENRIGLIRSEDEIELTCNGCDAWITESDYSQDNKLDDLSNALDRTLNLPSMLAAEIDDKWEILIRQYKFGSLS